MALEANERYFEQQEARLRSELEEGYPESWKPQAAGETVVGIMKGREVGPDLQYGPCWIVTLVDKDGKRWGIWLMHTVLQNQFERAAPNIGDLVAIQYDGKIRSEKQPDREIHNYSVRVSRPAGATVDWSAPPPGRSSRPAAATADFGDFGDFESFGGDPANDGGELPPAPDDSDIPF